MSMRSREWFVIFVNPFYKNFTKFLENNRNGFNATLSQCNAMLIV